MRTGPWIVRSYGGIGRRLFHRATERGKPAAVVVGVKRMQSILEREEDLRSAALVLSRAATDTGTRTSLDEVISAFGFDRAELEEELKADQAAGFTGASPVSPT